MATETVTDTVTITSTSTAHSITDSAVLPAFFIIPNMPGGLVS